jgi:cytochrome c6
MIQAGVFLLLALAICAGPARADDAAATLFKTKCAACHGPDGAGKTPAGAAMKVRDLRADEVQKQSDADLTATVTKGKNKMPAFGGKLQKEEIDQLVAYVRGLAKSK